MPAETHRLGRDADTACVVSLLWALLGDPGIDDSNVAGRTLADLDVDDAGVADLWAAVREEFGERGLGPEIDPDVFDPNMTVTAVAATMASLLVGGDHGD